MLEEDGQSFFRQKAETVNRVQHTNTKKKGKDTEDTKKKGANKKKGKGTEATKKKVENIKNPADAVVKKRKRDESEVLNAVRTRSQSKNEMNEQDFNEINKY